MTIILCAGILCEGSAMDDTVTILGAGIVGICSALSLQDRGVRVRLIDRGAPGQETSYGNAGIISPWSIVAQASAGHRP
ncbi:FAD-dependent oxidoreductase [Ascidiaceihabitans sp.]|uniref:FAD-dependent oxidoreductase n=2 Tax=Ascidiaceihabitans sp. TaxID=1872644 RepID=UPI003297D442